MARPFISWTKHQVERVAWLRELLDALGFEKPIVLDRGESTSAVEVVKENLRNADCMFALVAPDGSSSRMTEFVQHELTAAMLTEVPIAALVDPRVDMPEQMRQSFTWIQVDLTDDKALLAAVPKLVASALKIKRFLDHDVMSDAPSILEEVHIVNNLSPDQWLQARSILLTARQGFSSQIDHSVEFPMGRRVPGRSVKLANPDTDLAVTVGPRERFKPKLELKRNEDDEVRYIVSFDPKLRRGDSVRYRHRSVHPNIFPMTQREVREYAALPESPPFMRDGLVGDTWDVRRLIGKLILELEVGLDLGFSEPELRVYVQEEFDEFEEERSRIGNPRVAPRLWEVREDHSRGLWICRVTLPSPRMGRAYALLVRPPED